MVASRRRLAMLAAVLPIAGCSIVFPLGELQDDGTTSSGGGGSTSMVSGSGPGSTTSTSVASTTVAGSTTATGSTNSTGSTTSTSTVASSSVASGTGGGSTVDAIYAAAVEADGPIAYYRLREATTGVPAHDEIASL